MHLLWKFAASTTTFLLSAILPASAQTPDTTPLSKQVANLEETLARDEKNVKWLGESGPLPRSECGPHGSWQGRIERGLHGRFDHRHVGAAAIWRLLSRQAIR